MKWNSSIIIASSIFGMVLLISCQENANKETLPSRPSPKRNIEPGKYTAVLTKADGTTLVLDSSNNGIIMEPVNNSVTTPRGGQYKVALPDGTFIVLNSASTIRFPLDFGGKERRIELSGEAYFEVATNKVMPFNVVVNGVELKALGTRFNIKAYSDEKAIEATLLEGSLKVSKSEGSHILKPNQKAIIKNSIKVIYVDTTQVLAWKDGYFSFDGTGTDLEAVMRQVARWYDVEIEYQGKIPKIELVGKLSRELKIDDLINTMAFNGLSIQLISKERKIIIKG